MRKLIYGIAHVLQVEIVNTNALQTIANEISDLQFHFLCLSCPN